jgi:aspartyl-tRNA(Asn)/glutamyl-tRNA(Gln) amidotransferase subunit A
LGTDTGGSVRIPASLCGVYGLKPTHDAIIDDGVAPLSHSQDTVGILSKNINTIATVFSALSRTPLEVETPAESRTFKIGIDRHTFCDELDHEVAAAFEVTLEKCLKLGAEKIDVSFPAFNDLNLLASALTSFEAAKVHGHGLAHNPAHYPPPVRQRLLTAVRVDQSTYDAALTLRGILLEQVLASIFSYADVLLCPTLRKIAPNVSDVLDDDAVSVGSLSVEMLRQNRPLSYLGLPSLSIPVGRDRNGIPIGMQLIGRPHAEQDLCRLASLLAC